MEKRTEAGRLRHELGKKEWYSRKRSALIDHELRNGAELGYVDVRISDRWKEKILSGETQILVVNKEMIPFRKKQSNGYWFNNSWKDTTVYLHREKLKLELDLTDEQMEGLDVHHKDGNKDNNAIENLQLMSREKHNQIHGILNRDERKQTTCM